MLLLLLIFLLLNQTHTIKIPTTPKTKYYYDSRIHNFGNVGLGGQLHSLLAPYATTMIDNKCYNSVNIRQYILSKYNLDFYKNHEKLPKIIDLCCGTGTSTASNQLGIDTSEHMISKAILDQAKKNQLSLKAHTHTQFLIGNAENYGQQDEFDTATIMFAFHEMPNYAHHKIIKNAKKITKHDIIIMDIDPSYSPSKLMLSGEPYLLNYKNTIHKILTQHQFSYIEYIPKHVGLWIYSHNKS
jgi:ubiquinone/menaquinone biosynthesis C-methylase UbiE